MRHCVLTLALPTTLLSSFIFPPLFTFLTFLLLLHSYSLSICTLAFLYRTSLSVSSDLPILLHSILFIFFSSLTFIYRFELFSLYDCYVNYLILSYLILSYFILSYLILSYSYPVLLYSLLLFCFILT